MATPEAATETALAWGTRPAPRGDLYPVVDGQCIHMDVFPLPSGAAITYGNAVGSRARPGNHQRALRDGRGGGRELLGEHRRGTRADRPRRRGELSLPADARDVSVLRAANGAVYVVTTKRRLFEVRGSTVTEIPHAHATDVVASSTGTLWILDEQERVHERVKGVDRVLTLPEPPWARTGHYAVKAIHLVDDALAVNATYVERGLAWKTPEPWRALLSTRRPAEVLRCKDANDNLTAGEGFVPWPPKADASVRWLAPSSCEPWSAHSGALASGPSASSARPRRVWSSAESVCGCASSMALACASHVAARRRSPRE